MMAARSNDQHGCQIQPLFGEPVGVALETAFTAAQFAAVAPLLALSSRME